jgi:hypothetical protein
VAGGGPDVAARAGGVRSHEIGEVGVLMGGPGALCQVLNPFKPTKSTQTHSNLFQIILNLLLSKKGLIKLKIFKIKYGFEGFAERKNFLHSNFFKFEMGFELKFEEVEVCF